MKTVLVVEDSMVSMEGLLNALKAQRIKYVKAHNYNEAWQRFVEGVVDVALIDADIPLSGDEIKDIDRSSYLGIRLAREMKEQKRSIGIIIHTAYHDALPLVEELRKTYPDVFFEFKSGSAVRILTQLTKLLDKKRATIESKIITDPVARSYLDWLPFEIREVVQHGLEIWNDFTPVQQQIILYLAQGYTTKYLSGKMSNSTGHSQNLKTTIRQKMNMPDKMSLEVVLCHVVALGKLTGEINEPKF